MPALVEKRCTVCNGPGVRFELLAGVELCMACGRVAEDHAPELEKAVRDAAVASIRANWPAQERSAS